MNAWYFHLTHRSSDDYCHTFDLSVRVPDSVVQAALQASKLICLKVARSAKQPSTTEVLQRLSEILTSQESGNTPIRVCIPSLGSPFWGSLTSQVIRSAILYLLQSDRHPAESRVLPVFSPVDLAEASSGLCIHRVDPAHLQREVGWRRLATEIRVA